MFKSKSPRSKSLPTHARLTQARRALVATIEESGIGPRQAAQLLRTLADEYSRDAILHAPINPAPAFHSGNVAPKPKVVTALTRLISGRAA